MKQLTITIMLLLGVFTSSAQTYLTDSPRHVLECGDVIKKGSTVTIDTLVLTCMQTLLLQDNSTLNVKHVVWFGDENADWTSETARFMYGDVGWDENTDFSVGIDTIRRTDMNTFDYNDYRLTTDRNPVVNFTECRPTGIIGDPNVDIIFGEYCPDITLDDEEFVVSPENERDLDCTIWSMTGQEMYTGPFDGIFHGNCGAECLDYLYWNKVLLIEFRTLDGNGKLIRIRVKRIYVR